MNYFLGSILTLGAFILGYFIGYDKLKLEQPKEIEKMVDKALGRDLKPGVILRPTQQDLIDRKNPKIKEGTKEFKKLLDTLPIKD